MTVTIATHNGNKVAHEHNVRNRNVTNKETHIDPNGEYEIWKDEKVRDAYARIFGQAVEDYNAKQTRAERKIDSYYNQITKDAKKKPVYEMIVGVYPPKEGEIDQGTAKAILNEFVFGWSARNPNLELIGAYYHADEEGKAPHVHLDYIPVAEGYTRGMEKQTGLVKALEQQGIHKGRKETLQIAWERRENRALEDICRVFGYIVEHPQAGKDVKHLETENYKLTQRNKELVERNTALESQIIDQEAELDSLYEAIQRYAKQAGAKKEELEKELKELRKSRLAKIRSIDSQGVAQLLAFSGWLERNGHGKLLEDFAKQYNSQIDQEYENAIRVDLDLE